MPSYCHMRARPLSRACHAGVIAALLAGCGLSWAADGSSAPRTPTAPLAATMQASAPPRPAAQAAQDAQDARPSRCVARSAPASAWPDAELLRWHQSVRRLGPLG